MKAFAEDASAAISMRGEFTSTHWSLVLTAGHKSSPGSQAALETLCKKYWYPLYAHVRRRGHSPEDAQDLTQDFFARLLRKEYLRRADRKRGRFRTFLLTSLQRFLVNDWEKSRSQRRGGGQSLFSLDKEKTEGRYLAEPAEEATPEKIFEKRWAVTLLEQVLFQLREEFASNGKEDQFDRLKVLLWGEKDAPPYADVAADLGMSEGALKVAVHRLRQRYRELLRLEVAQTGASPAEVDEELRHLISVMSE